MSRFSRLSAIALLAVAAIGVAVADVGRAAYDCAAYCVSAIGRFASKVLFGPTPFVESAREPSKLIVRSKAFVLTLVQRQRPRIEASWRMCPST